ncbi:PHD finger protein EHD3-like isoform X3 [Musa acuminata AAA Group]|uniref:PHD finger protein EHD3-like isoform X3 n=1 Tax=Musa acuminata AAA Group TaxID=214697 RepID=UPI0031DFEE64
MAVEEQRRNGSLKMEESSLGGPMTCDKRKRAGSSPNVIQVCMPSRKEKTKDIGWDHGKIVDGNRFQWMCNWCGLVRYGGGVSRLKKHLAGVCDVRKCPNVPEEIAKEIMNHLIEKQKHRKRRLVARGIKGRRQKCSPHCDLLDKDHIKGDNKAQVGSANELSRKDIWETNIASERLKIMNQQSTTTMGLTGMTEQDMEELHDQISCTRTVEEDRYSRREHHWKYVLESILQFPDMSEGGGISCCIRDALTYGPEFTKKFKMTDILGNTVQLKDNKVKLFFDFSLINSKMKNGDYKQSPGLFSQDIQEVWDKCQKFGEEMVLLASNLSSMSHVSCQKHDTCQVVAERKSFAESNKTAMHLTFCESGQYTKLDQAKASPLYKVPTCRQCAMEANGECSLICGGCQAMYHISCIKPALVEIPTQSWYCIVCNAYEKESPEPFSICTRKDIMHKNHLVYDGLKTSGTQEYCIDSDSRIVRASNSTESSVSFMETDESPELPRTAQSFLCKICGTCEDEDKKFLICDHVHCPYKFYHIRCLKSSQIASLQQQKKSCWYCPSCLCRACFCDKDDDRIVLCDGCDEAYHTYCMRPPCTSIPKGQWYCQTCNASMERKGTKRHKQRIAQQHRKNDDRQFNEVSRAVDLLLTAAEKLSSEEQLMAGENSR